MTTCDTAAAPAARVDLTMPHGRKQRMERLTERAEVLFVREVVRDGGVTPWRRRTESRIRAARDAYALGRLAWTETATLVVALVDVPLRDVCARLVEDDPHPAWVDLWLHLARHALPPFRTEPLFLLGWTAWHLGDAHLATAAVVEARRQEPAHRPAALLARLLAGGVGPGGRASAARRPGA